MRVDPALAPPPDYAPFPEPSVAIKSGGRRWLMYQADFPATLVARGGTIHCKVCRLLCGIDFTEDQANKGYVTGTPPSQLMLCRRHYLIINELVNKEISLDNWPSQLIRGMVNHYAEVVWAMEVVIFNITNAINAGQQIIQSTPAMRSMPFLMPMTGFSFNPSVSGSFADYDFFLPSMINVPNKQGMREIESITYAQNSLRGSMNEAQRIIQKSKAEQEKFQGILGHLLKEFAPKFQSCLNCGQTEIPIYSKICPWCGQSNVIFREEVIPKKALVQEVDPLGIVPMYDDLLSPIEVFTGTGEVNKTHVRNDLVSNSPAQTKDETSLYCQQCGVRQRNSTAKFCFSCGSKIIR